MTNGCNDNDTSWSTKTISTSTIYLQSGNPTLTVFSDGSFYHSPPAIPCSMPNYSFVLTIPNGFTIDFKTGELKVTSNII